MFSSEHSGPLGLWCLKTIDRSSGETIKEEWRKNLLLDTGAIAAWKNTINATGAVVNPFNQIAITTNCGSTSTTTALVSGQSYGGASTLACTALPAGISATTGTGSPAPATRMLLGNPFGQNQVLTLTGGASQGATLLSVAGFTANANYSVGTPLVPMPNETENPTSLGGTVSYSGVLNQFSFTGSGTGKRQVYTFCTFSTTATGQPGQNAAAGNYCDAWLTNANPVNAAGQCAVHVTFSPQAVGTSSNLQVNCVELL